MDIFDHFGVLVTRTNEEGKQVAATNSYAGQVFDW
jgi:hypothetical protein